MPVYSPKAEEVTDIGFNTKSQRHTIQYTHTLILHNIYYNRVQYIYIYIHSSSSTKTGNADYMS